MGSPHAFDTEAPRWWSALMWLTTACAVGVFALTLAAIWVTGDYWPDRLVSTAFLLFFVGFLSGSAATMSSIGHSWRWNP